MSETAIALKARNRVARGKREARRPWERKKKIPGAPCKGAKTIIGFLAPPQGAR